MPTALRGHVEQVKAWPLRAVAMAPLPILVHAESNTWGTPCTTNTRWQR
jgi:hypothetical protein